MLAEVFTVFGETFLRIMLSIRVRLLAFLMDLSLGHILFYAYSDFFSRFFPTFLLDEGHPVAVVFAMLLIPTFTVRFYGALFWGVSPGQWLCCLGVQWKGIRSRLLGMVRVFLEIVAIPLFFIFQFPLLRGRESWGERISGAPLSVKSNPSLFVQLLMVATFAVFSLLIPLFQYFIFSENLELSFSHQRLSVADYFRSDSVNSIYSSNRFHFQARSILNEERFVLLPDFELIKIKNKKKIRPFLIIYDLDNRKVGQFKPGGKVDLLSILEKGRRGNPLFQHYYPKMNELLSQDRNNYKRVPYLDKYNGNPLIDIETQKEIEFFIGDILSTKFSRMGIHLITKGPFVRGYWEAKKDLLKLTPEEVRPEIFLLSLGDQRFLHFRQIYSRLENPVRNTYVPIGTGNAVAFHLIWEEGSGKTEKTFLKEFFYSTKWYFDFEKTFSFPVDDNSLTPFHIVDYFIDKNIDEEQRKILENYLLKFCYLVSKKAVERSDRKLEELLLNIFERYRFIAQIDHVGVRKQLLSGLALIQKRLKLQDDNFFKKSEM